MQLLAPIIYILIGLFLGRTSLEIKDRASAFLTKVVIPIVIIFNIATSDQDVYVVIVGMMIIMGIMLLISRAGSNDPINNLCFCYLNIGWLGLPLITVFFGDQAAMVAIAAYVGSSLFGNSIGVGLMTKHQSLKERVVQTLSAPPVWSLIIGLACLPLRIYIEEYFTAVYAISKFLMSLLGMTVLGIWLAKAPLKRQDFRTAIIQFAYRFSAMFLLCTVFIFICKYYEISLVTDNKAALYLICLLPPAANIIVLETHYMKSGRSASLIACGTCISFVALFVYIFVMYNYAGGNL
jgi:predicted permease